MLLLVKGTRHEGTRPGEHVHVSSPTRADLEHDLELVRAEAALSLGAFGSVFHLVGFIDEATISLRAGD